MPQPRPPSSRRPRHGRPLALLAGLGGLCLLTAYVVAGWRSADPEPLVASPQVSERVRALRAGDPHANDVLGAVRDIERQLDPQSHRPNPDPRLREAAVMLSLLAEEGHGRAQWRLGWYLLNGWGVERDRCSATAWFEKAARQGERQAQFRLAVALLPPNGQGVAPDPLAAYRWASEARRQGHELSGEVFDILFWREMTPEQRAAAEESSKGWTPADEPPLEIRRYPYLPLVVGLWPRQTDHVMPCRQPHAPYETPAG